jgi:hypothetical protein
MNYQRNSELYFSELPEALVSFSLLYYQRNSELYFSELPEALSALVY